MRLLIGVLLVAGLAPGVARAATPSVKRFAIVVGYNQSDKAKLPSLRYADDDAVLSAQLMRELGAKTVLFAEFDKQTKDAHPGVRAQRPMLGGLAAAFKEVNKQVTAARARGHRTELYFFYTGHGDVEAGEGYVQLASGRLYRRRLLSLLTASQADFNHVIIDACKSYFVVFDRGPGGSRKRTKGGFLPPDIPLPQRTGFVLSTSSAQNSHEWEALQAGIFSHEVRSALRGAADLNGDGRVSYRELGGFVHAANRTIPNHRFRPRFFVRAPRKGKKSAELIDLRSAQGRRIIFDLKRASHFFVETTRGVRLADLHPGPKGATLLVPAAGKLYVRNRSSKQEYVIEAKPKVLLAELQPTTPRSRVRGAAHEAFTHLFEAPFNRTALIRFEKEGNRATILIPPLATAPRWVRPALGILSLASLVVGGTFTGLAIAERNKANDDTPHARRQAINRVVRRNNAIAITGYAVGGAAGVGYLVWTLWPEREVPVQLSARFSLARASVGVRW